MNPTELIAAFGPIGGVFIYLYVTHQKSKADPKPVDPTQKKLDTLLTAVAGIDKRVAVVETILEERKK